MGSPLLLHHLSWHRSLLFFLVVAPSPCCDVVVAVSLSILQDVSIQSQDSRSISDSTPYGSPRNSPKVFLFRMITLFNARRGIPEREEKTSKKRVGVGTRHFNSRLPLRCPVGSDRAGDPTNPIIITHTSYITGIRSGPSWESACG